MGDHGLPAVVELQLAAARRLGLDGRILDEEHGLLFELSDGRRRVALLGGRSPLNDAVAARLAGDKFYTGLLLAERGFRVPETARCLKPGYFTNPRYAEAAGDGPGRALAAERGFPLIAKPNRKSHGREVSRVDDLESLERAVARIWEIDSIALVQERIAGADLRLDFLDGAFLAGYERRPGEGDGAGEVLNLNRGARPRLVRELPDDWLEVGRAIGEAMSLRHFGVDLRGAALDDPPRSATVIEVNASPLLLRLWQGGFAEEALAAQARVLRAVFERGRPEADEA